MGKPDKPKTGWGFDKRIGPATITMLAQLIAVLYFGITFYNQVNFNQARNEDRFKDFAEQRAVQNSQMVELQKAQNQLLVQMTAIASRLDTTSEYVKDMRDSLRIKGR